MGDAIGLIGLHFALIGFASGLFFARIDSWYNSVRSLHGSVVALEERNEYIRAKAEMLGLKASEPRGSFVAVGLLSSALALLSFLVPRAPSAINPYLFIYPPLVVTVAIYWLGGATLLRRGRIRLTKAEEEIDKGLHG